MGRQKVQAMVAIKYVRGRGKRTVTTNYGSPCDTSWIKTAVGIKPDFNAVFFLKDSSKCLAPDLLFQQIFQADPLNKIV